MSVDVEVHEDTREVKTTFVQMVGPVEILLVTIGGDSVGEYDALCSECDDHAAMAATRTQAIDGAYFHWRTQHEEWC